MTHLIENSKHRLTEKDGSFVVRQYLPIGRVYQSVDLTAQEATELANAILERVGELAEQKVAA